MSEVVNVRLAKEEDVDFICEANVAMATETEDLGLNQETLRQGISYLMEHPREGMYLVAEVNGTAAGTLMVTFEWSDWRNGRFWWIQSVYVHEEFRRLGVYSAMHHYVRSIARKDPQACGIRLYVERENESAQATYLALGMFETHYRLFEEGLSGGSTE